jgi:RNA polymerase sigma factor (sigma-70 family)
MRDDASVIEASLTDPEDFAAIFDRHAPCIQRYLARRVGEQAADDLLADTFLLAFGKRKIYDPRYRDALPWLYGIATNVVRQHRRQEARQLRLSQALTPTAVTPDHSERTAVNLTARALRPVLIGAVARLARPDRDVLLLAAWEQLSYDEIARALGVPVGTVRSRLHRARAKVREALGETGAAVTFEEVLTSE